MPPSFKNNKQLKNKHKSFSHVTGITKTSSLYPFNSVKPNKYFT